MSDKIVDDRSFWGLCADAAAVHDTTQPTDALYKFRHPVGDVVYYPPKTKNLFLVTAHGRRFIEIRPLHNHDALTEWVLEHEVGAVDVLDLCIMRRNLDETIKRVIEAREE